MGLDIQYLGLAGGLLKEAGDLGLGCIENILVSPSLTLDQLGSTQRWRRAIRSLDQQPALDALLHWVYAQG